MSFLQSFSGTASSAALACRVFQLQALDEVQEAHLRGRVDAGHRREALDQADDGAEQADQRDDVGEGGDVVGALLEARHDLHHSLFLSLIHISEPTRLLSISYAVFCLKK